MVETPETADQIYFAVLQQKIDKVEMKTSRKRIYGFAHIQRPDDYKKYITKIIKRQEW